MNRLSLLSYATNIIECGSKSFAFASRIFDSKTRESILMLYSWCRYCDDFIDNQTMGFLSKEISLQTTKERLNELKIKTKQAYDGIYMYDLPFFAFQKVAIKHNILPIYAFTHLKGFSMDISKKYYETFNDTLQYCYYVSGIIGIMIAKIIGINDNDTLDCACDLGIAFQLTNIARDIIDDAYIGRCYLPTEWLQKKGLNKYNFIALENRQILFNIVKRLLDESVPYYLSASTKLFSLPFRSALAIATAKNIYYKISIKIIKKKHESWNTRISISKLEKIFLFIFSLYQTIKYKLFFSPLKSSRPSNLWKRPDIIK